MTRAKWSNSYTVAYCEGSRGLLDKLVRSGDNKIAKIKLKVVKRSCVPTSTLPSSVIVRLLEDFVRLLEDFVDIKETGVLAIIDVDQILMQCFNTSFNRTCTQLTYCVNSIESIL